MLLGIASPVIKAHGSSDGGALFHAIGQAKTCVEGKVVETIVEALAAQKQAAKAEVKAEAE